MRVAEEIGEIVGFANFIYGEELYLSAHMLDLNLNIEVMELVC